jgi:uncharacterized protein YunC (DUF1805 family)
MKTQPIKLEHGIITGYYINLGNAPFLLLQAKKGYLMCGYLNMSTANRLGDIAGIVKGVHTFEDMLKGTVAEVSEKAKDLGLTPGISGQAFLKELL